MKALITGATSGIGREMAKILAARGVDLIIASRDEKKMKSLAKRLPVAVRTIAVDLSKAEDCYRLYDAVKAEEIDILINNAGYGSYGAIENVPMEEAKRQFDVNLFGMARLIQYVTPYMRENHYGKIINVSSMGGKIWTKFGGWYHATKFAVEGFSDCLCMELKPFGIDVVVVEPGGIKTDWGIIAAENLKKTSANGTYAEAANKAADGMIKDYSGNMLSKPELIAKTVRKAVTKRRPRTHYLIGFGAKPMVLTHKIFGDRMFDWVIRNFS